MAAAQGVEGVGLPTSSAVDGGQIELILGPMFSGKVEYPEVARLALAPAILLQLNRYYEATSLPVCSTGGPLIAMGLRALQTTELLRRVRRHKAAAQRCFLVSYQVSLLSVQCSGEGSGAGYSERIRLSTESWLGSA